MLHILGLRQSLSDLLRYSCTVHTRPHAALLTHMAAVTLLQVEKFQKCGGSGGNNAVDAGACCTSGYYCARVNQWHWQCEANNAPVVNGTVINGTAAAPVTMIIDGKTYPVCANPAAAGSPDAYNRRWGWETGRTCVVPPPGVMPVGMTDATTPVVNGSYATTNSTGCEYTVSPEHGRAYLAHACCQQLQLTQMLLRALTGSKDRLSASHQSNSHDCVS
jgi:hypothetical protein